ncbi:hypothetical protein H696_05614 [Fonticula alba]|uniref:Uncharacterized protein n=1 Tax=Fonticula alba TaxID=691883 RepID=A0A058Z0V1_FONAL|nr:hypothetical protein H696_05614 [Fonticula alba]KCV67885.1 hypothetical protein H696_05614 [Fonticula alba]|eukprot:XP_009497705.1 hypothetical protein H696_05614 [Fonticula alba]
MTGSSVPTGFAVSSIHNSVLVKDDILLPGFFEGPEKLLEVTFVMPGVAPAPPVAAAAPAAAATAGGIGAEMLRLLGAGPAASLSALAADLPAAAPVSCTASSPAASAATTSEPAKVGLRAYTAADWQPLLDSVNCLIINSISNASADAYLLSESSLFVFADRIILKTCGTTTLLRCLKGLLAMAARAGATQVESVFYSRKNFLQPADQPAPHVSFEAEVACLREAFPRGRVLTLGDQSGDHWHLFAAETGTGHMQKVPRAPRALCPATGGAGPALEVTTEILMHELDQDLMRVFYRTEPGWQSTADSTRRSGVGAILPGALLDDLVFDPFGYSVNALLGEFYFTIHVTPQENCSFASFETNYNRPDLPAVVARALAVFRPGRFTLTHFDNAPGLRAVAAAGGPEGPARVAKQLALAARLRRDLAASGDDAGAPAASFQHGYARVGAAEQTLSAHTLQYMHFVSTEAGRPVSALDRLECAADLSGLLEEVAGGLASSSSPSEEGAALAAAPVVVGLSTTTCV